MLITSHFSRSITEFPSKTSNSLKNFITFFQDFFINSSSFWTILFGFIFHKPHWRTVYWNRGQKLQDLGLLEACTTMANGWILQLKHHRAKLIILINFHSLDLLLFWWITRGKAQINLCHLQEVRIRILRLLELSHGFCRSFSVD